jgi:hypothetical protein
MDMLDILFLKKSLGSNIFLRSLIIFVSSLCQTPAKRQNLNILLLLLLAQPLFRFIKTALYHPDATPIPQHNIHSIQIQSHIVVQVRWDKINIKKG